MNEPYGDIDGEIEDDSAKLTTTVLLKALQESHSEIVQDNEPYDQSWFKSFWPLTKIST